MGLSECSLSHIWVLDSGCGQHATSNRQEFLTFEPIPQSEGVTINGIGDIRIPVLGKGTVRKRCETNTGPKWVSFTDTLYAPKLGVNLISVSQLLDKGARIDLRQDTGEIFIPGDNPTTVYAERFGNLFALKSSHTAQPALAAYALAAYSVDPKWKLWHERMGHLSEQSLMKLEHITKGMEEAKTYCTCEACVLGRMREGPHKGALPKGKHAGDVIFADVCGPFHIKGHDGERYWLTMVDGHSRLSSIHPMKNREHVWEHVDWFVKFLEKREPQGKKCRVIHMDKGGEFISNGAKTWARKRGIHLQWTATEQHESNGMAESLNITIRDKLLPTMIGGNIPKEFWPEVLQTVNYLRNRSPHSALDVTPWQMVYGQEPNIGHIRTLGTKVWYLLPSTKRKKLDDKAAEGILVGYRGASIYRILNSKGKIIEAAVQNVHFAEERGAGPRLVSIGTQTDDADRGARRTHAESPPTKRQRHAIGDEPQQTRSPRTQPAGNTLEVYPDLSLDTSIKGHPELRYPLRNKTSMTKDHLYMLFSVLALAADTSRKDIEPLTLAEAKRSYFWPKWREAMSDEFESLVENDTWELVKPKSQNHVLRGKWVYKHKTGAENEITRHKARWVVRGFEQISGIDYFETFASVVKPMSYKVLFNIAAARDLEIEQMDVKTAFLYGKIEEEIYVEQPTGLDDGTGRVCRLKRALYGLKQAPRVWFQTLSDFLATLGFEPISADSGVFVCRKTGIFIAVYVDDLLLVGQDKEEISKVKKALNERFKMTDLGPCQYYLGIRIRRDRRNRTIYLDQQGYINKILELHGMSTGKAVDTPMTTTKLQKAKDGYIAPEEMKRNYQSAVGSLMYLMMGTRPDIAYAVSCVSRYSSNPTDPHWQAVKRIFRYLIGSKNLCLVYQGELEPLAGYTDADWAGDPDTRRSTSGYVFDLGSAVVSWSSKRQPVVATSSCEAEYRGQANAAKEAIWLKRLFQELSPDSEGGDGDAEVKTAPSTVVIYADNQGAIALAKNPTDHSRTKHIEIQQHFVREKVAEGEIELEYVRTEDMVADGLTKALPRDSFLRFREALGLRVIPGDRA